MLAIFLEEWPLLLFTLFAQLAIGTYLLIIIIRSFRNVDKKINNEITKKGILIVGPIMLVALILSLLHLGDPLKAYLSIGNLAASWLSREILFAGMFFVLWVISYYLDRINKWNQIIGWITAAVGIVAIFSMASIYSKTVNPAWTSINTYISFFGTTILFGAIVTSALFLFNNQVREGGYNVIKNTIVLVGFTVVVIQLVYLPVYMANLQFSNENAKLEPTFFLSNTFATSTIIRWVLSITALLIIGYVLNKKTSMKTQYFFYSIAFALVLAGEFIGRLMFYTAGIQVS